MRKSISTRLIQGIRQEWIRLPQGAQLPGERVLATQYGVSRPTIRKIITTLTREGVVYSVPGKGLYRGAADRQEALGIRGSSLALSLTDITHFNVEVVAAVVDEATKHGMNVLTHKGGREPDAESQYLSDLMQTPRLRGLLINPPLQVSQIEDLLPEYRRLQASGIRVVIVNAPGVDLPLDHVCFDDRGGVAMMVRHVVELGHRRIAHVRGRAQHVRQASREAGFHLGMTGAGLEPAETVIMDEQLTHMISGDPVSLVRRQGVTAFVAHNEDIAALLYRVLSTAGIRVPAEVSICGYDHLPHVDRGVPVRFTSAVRDRRMLGCTAFGMLLRRLLEQEDSPAPPRLALLPVQLSLGDTVAPPRQD